LGSKGNATTTWRSSASALPAGAAPSVARTVMVRLPAAVTGTSALQVDQSSAALGTAGVKPVCPSSDHSTSATPLWVSDAVPRNSRLSWPSTSVKVSPSRGALMASAGAVMSPTRTLMFCSALTLPTRSRARTATLCWPKPGSGTSAVQLVVPLALLKGPPASCHSTAATPEALSVAVPRTVAMKGGDGRTTSAGGSMLNVGGWPSTRSAIDAAA
jgi:hypothetical protein